MSVNIVKIKSQIHTPHIRIRIRIHVYFIFSGGRIFEDAPQLKLKWDDDDSDT